MAFALRIVWSTTITPSQKIGLGIVFSLGAFIIAFAVVRAINITGRAYSDQAGLAVWSIAESSICMRLFPDLSRADDCSGDSRLSAPVQDVPFAQQLDVRVSISSCLWREWSLSSETLSNANDVLERDAARAGVRTVFTPGSRFSRQGRKPIQTGRDTSYPGFCKDPFEN